MKMNNGIILLFKLSNESLLISKYNKYMHNSVQYKISLPRLKSYVQ